jgi:TRAP-type C4-dicarboxylate transport system substrate-binding protein
MKTLKFAIFVVIAILAFAAVFATACGDKEDTPPADTPSANTDEQPLEPVSLSMSMHDPETSNNGKFMADWAREVNEKTNGGVTINITYSGGLFSSKDVGQAVQTGSVDIGWMYTSYYPEQFPLTDVTTIPFAGFGDPVITTNTLWDLYDKYPQLAQEWSNYGRLLDLYGNPGMLFASTEKEIQAPADIKGLTISAPAGFITEYVKALGGVPVVIEPSGLLEAVQKNNIRAYVFEPIGITNFKLETATKYFTDFPIYDGAFGLVMNQAKFDSLPQEYKDVILETTQRTGSLKAAEDLKTVAENSKKVISDAGGIWIEVRDKDAWVKQAVPMQEAWPGNVKLDGFDAEAFLGDAINIADSYN